MILKSIEMQGYKSFPDQTLIEFQSGVTAIVGPNGSGKSNITDAVRWVLGEQNARVLRGRKMEDVIFSGTENRRRMSFAEVTLHLDNSSKIFPIDYEDLSITRRYFRSGESEYLINGTPVRLKDISRLFADTGIGRDGYSIISQGRVDELLSSHSEDRRRVFDEAAGIVKYKLRKSEAISKLDRTEQNLLRIDDILNELEQRRRPLERQAETAKLFRILDAEHKELDIALCLLDVSESEMEITTVNEQCESFRSDLEQNHAKLAELVLKDAELSATDSARERTLEVLQGEYDALSETLAANSENKTVLRELRRSLNESAQRLLQEASELEKGLSLHDSGVKESSAKLERLEKSQAKFIAELADAEAEMKLLTNDLSEAALRSEAQKSALDDLRELLFERKSELKSFETENRLSQSRLKVLTDNVADMAAEVRRAVFRSEDCGESQIALENEAETLKKTLIEAVVNSEKANAKCTECDRKIQELRELEHNLSYRLKTLRQLESNREGYHQAVRAIMKESEKSTVFAQDICGPVAELLRVDASYDLAIETALGSAQHHIVTRNRNKAADLIRWLKSSHNGRETFLPLDVISGSRLSHSEIKIAQRHSGYIGLAVELVQFDPQYTDIFNNLLGRIIVCKDIDSAMEISELCKRHYKIVSLEGDLIHPGGSMTGGFTRQGSAGLLARSREIEELEKKVEIQTERIVAAEQDLNKAKDELITAAEMKVDIEAKFTIAEQKRVKNESDLKLLQSQQMQKNSELTRLQAELGELSRNISGRTENLATIQLEVDKLEEERQALESQIAAFTAEQKDQEQLRDEYRERISDLKVSLGSIAESLLGLQSLAEQVEKEKTRNLERIASLRTEAESTQKKASSTLTEEQEAIANEDALRQKLNAVNEKIRETRNQQNAHQDELRQLYAGREELNRLSAQLELQLDRLLQRQELLKLKISDLKNQVWERHHLSFPEAAEQYAETRLESPNKARRRTKELREEILKLGAVNLGAEEEFAQLSERLDFMQSQRDDIERSRKELHLVIQELEKAMKDLFYREFCQINQNFTQVFKSLFSGGHAELLLNDEDDLLNSEIEIKAQPPGKKLQSLSLLSGGETALTAIALIFAIFQLRPAPFCILDEVESALDDSNIVRFADYIRHYTEKTQFILVTHRKGTMEAADRLYGVSMKEKGISSVLSMIAEEKNAE